MSLNNENTQDIDEAYWIGLSLKMPFKTQDHTSRR